MAGDEVFIVHAADIHLDSPLRGLGRLGDDDLVAELRGATRKAFDNLIRHCCETRPDALVIAGDLYDGDWRDYSTGVHFTNGMRDLNDAGVPVIIVAGNHDAESVITRSLTLPDNVTFLSTEAPGSKVLEHAGLAVHGQGFATKSVTSNLAIAYPSPVPGFVNVGLLHTSVQGYDGHDSYAPCSVIDLAGRGYEYFALGHVHTREILVQGPQTVAFSGNLQGRHPRETGPKGALDVRLRPGSEALVEFVPLDVARWEILDVDVTEADDERGVFGLVEKKLSDAREAAGTRALVARVRLIGASGHAGTLADAERLGYEIRPMAARHGVAVDKITSEVTTPPERRHLPPAQRAVFDAVLDRILADPSLVLEDPDIKNDLDTLTSELNEQFLRGVGTDLRNERQLMELVVQAAHRLREKAEGGLL